MSTAIEKRQATVPAVPDSSELGHVMEVVRSISQTEFVPKSLRGNNAAILACVLFGREIGLGPMESLSEVHMIDGRPSLSAKAKLKRARERGHSITVVEETATACVLRGRRGDNGDEMTVGYTFDEATAAGLTGKANWQKHRGDMLFARAASRLCRRLFDDVPGALTLDPDEAELTDEERTVAALVDLPPVEMDEPLVGEVVDSGAEPAATGAPDVGEELTTSESAPDQEEQGSFFEAKAQEAQRRRKARETAE